MGIAEWKKDVLCTVASLNKEASFIEYTRYDIIQCNAKVYLHLISLNQASIPIEFVELQNQYIQDEKLLIHLWEDVWLSNQIGVLSRIKSFLGLNQTFHARKAKLIEVDNELAHQFFNKYHLQGAVKAKYHYGLTINNELIALAGFSYLRTMKTKGKGYTSAELVRFASKNGYTITGGLSKLISHFLTLYQPNDLMTYADRDWSVGKGYLQLNFKLTTITEPADLYVELRSLKRFFPHRLPKEILSGFDMEKELNLDEYLIKQGFVKVFNTGNLKYHLYN